MAVAAAFAVERGGDVHAVIQSDAADDVRAAAAAVGRRDPAVVARGDTASTVAAVRARHATRRGAVAVTGGSALVAPVRDALRDGGVRDLRAKAYWIPGRTGLD